MSTSANNATGIHVETLHGPGWNSADQRQWQEFTDRHDAMHSDPRWLRAVCIGLNFEPYGLVARRDGVIVGVLPLARMKSVLFGKFLVSLPYVNLAGVVADDEQAAVALVDRAVELADQEDVRYLQLRHEKELQHPALTEKLTSKVHMRLSLPATSELLWKQFTPKVRNQIRKGENQGFSVHWGGAELLRDFYTVFSQNMRDLGTPVFSRRLFEQILVEFPEQAEFCTVRDGKKAVASGLLVHSNGLSQVPSASSLKNYRSTNANMFLYWNLLQRAVERGQGVFDFGRSSEGSATYRFKKQWGAKPHKAIWQYYVRAGSIGDLRPDTGKYRFFIRLWKLLPVQLTRWIGPLIVRGIP